VFVHIDERGRLRLKHEWCRGCGLRVVVFDQAGWEADLGDVSCFGIDQQYALRTARELVLEQLSTRLGVAEPRAHRTSLDLGYQQLAIAIYDEVTDQPDGQLACIRSYPVRHAFLVGDDLIPSLRQQSLSAQLSLVSTRIAGLTEPALSTQALPVRQPRANAQPEQNRKNNNEPNAH